MNRVTAGVYNFYDFYYILAIEADLLMQKSANPDNEFRHSFVRLENDVQAYKAKFAELYAENIVNYLWAACLGEARHASDMCFEQGSITLPELDGRGRSSVYNRAHQYPVNRANLDIMLQIYSQEWRSGFGGEKWLDIIEAVDDYFTGILDAVSFIDHVVDLQHNGGSAFNKSAQTATGFSSDGIYDIEKFLNYKRDYDILRNRSHYAVVQVSSRVKKLIDRHNYVIEGKLVTDWARFSTDVPTVTKSWVEYESKTLKTDEVEDNRNYCEYNDHYTRDSITNINGASVCSDCKSENFTYCDCGHYEHDDHVTWIDGKSHCEDCESEISFNACYDCGDNHTDCIEIEGDFYCEVCASANFAHCEEHETYYASGENCPKCEAQDEAETPPPQPEPLPSPTENSEKLLFKFGSKNAVAQIEWYKGTKYQQTWQSDSILPLTGW